MSMEARSRLELDCGRGCSREISEERPGREVNMGGGGPGAWPGAGRGEAWPSPTRPSTACSSCPAPCLPDPLPG